MSKTSFKAHFDGQHIVIDEPVTLTKGTPLVVSALSEGSEAVSSQQPAEAQTRRLFALLMGAGYMLFVAGLLGEVTKWTFGFSFGVTVIGCLVVMSALALLGVKAYRKTDERSRFTFSTVFLASVPLSVYLAALRLLLRDTPLESLTALMFFMISTVSVIGMVLSKIILLSFAEALIWLAVACVPKRQNRQARSR